MPRGRRPDPIKKMLLPLAVEFAEKVAAVISEHVSNDVSEKFRALADSLTPGASAHPGRKAGAKKAGGRRKITPCRAPGCTNPSKGPRYKFFCEEHRQSLSDEEKAKITAAHKASAKAGGSSGTTTGGELAASGNDKTAQTKKAKAKAGKKKAGKGKK